MSTPLTLAVVIAASYLVGSMPFGFVAVCLFKGVDIRTVGSKNVGATNVMRVAGKGLGIAVLVLDVLKGVAGVLLIGGLVGPALAAGPLGDQTRSVMGILCGAAAILGHVFTLFLRFRGGKGVATTLGVVLSLVPFAALIAMGVFIVVVAIWRYVSLGSISAAIALVMAELVLTDRPFGVNRGLTIFCVLMAALVIARHASNIKRLLAGTENKLGVRTKPAEDREAK